MTFVSSRRPCDSLAFATSSYDTNFAQPLSAATFVSAAVSVVLPWSMWPIVPTLTWGLDRSNFSLAMFLARLVCRARLQPRQPPFGADDRDRTGDLVLTKDVLCQLSYIGGTQSSLSLERETGIEPATNSLEGCDSTTELLPQIRAV